MAQESAAPAQDLELLVSVAEQLKVPLTTIARQAELGQLTAQPGLVDLNVLRTQADAALKLVDSYLLGLELARNQTQLELEPVSISSLLVDAAHDLSRFAKAYDVELELRLQGRYGPVMSNPRGLKAVLLSLGFVLIEVQASAPKRRLALAMHRTPHGIVAGLYGMQETMSAAEWRTALKLCGQAPQAASGIAAGSGAGLFVADAILRSMSTQLRVGRYERLTGLAATMQPSHQLQFV